MEPRDIMHRPMRAIPNRELPRIEFRSSTRAWLLQSGQGWLVLALALIAMIGGFALTSQGWWVLLGVLALLGLYCLWRYVENRSALYWLDGERLFMRRGILMRSEEEVELYRIKDVKVAFSIIQQLFGNGTIVITSSDASGVRLAEGGAHGRSVISVAHVYDARLIRGEIRDRVEAIRTRRGVREFDIG